MEISEADKKSHNVWKPVLFVVFIALIIIVFRLAGWGNKIDLLRNWIDSYGSLGPLIYVLVYIVAVIVAIPGSAVTLVGAALFGSLYGVILVSIASTIGAALAFLLSRYLARDYILRRLGQNEKFRKLDSLTRQHGAIIVAIVRLVPLFPFNIVNYGFGLTAVSFGTYIFWSWFCMLPGTILYVVGTDAVVRALASGEIPWLLIGVFLLTLFILVVLIRQAKKKISEKENSDTSGKL